MTALELVQALRAQGCELSLAFDREPVGIAWQGTIAVGQARMLGEMRDDVVRILLSEDAKGWPLCQRCGCEYLAERFASCPACAMACGRSALRPAPVRAWAGGGVRRVA